MRPWIKPAALFLSGALIGSAVTTWGIHCSFENMRHHSGDSGYLLDRLTHNLDLTPDQKEKAAVLVKESIPKMDALRDGLRVQTKAVWDSFDAKLRTILTEDQKKKLDEMERRWRAHQDHGPGFGGPPPPGGGPGVPRDR